MGFVTQEKRDDEGKTLKKILHSQTCFSGLKVHTKHRLEVLCDIRFRRLLN